MGVTAGYHNPIGSLTMYVCQVKLSGNAALDQNCCYRRNRAAVLPETPPPKTAIAGQLPTLRASPNPFPCKCRFSLLFKPSGLVWSIGCSIEAIVVAKNLETMKDPAAERLPGWLASRGTCR